MAAPERFELTPGYTIARIENGTWQLSSGHTIHGGVDLADVNHAFHELVARGFTTFDTGDIYNGSEQVIGDFVRELKAGRGAVSADDIQIHTKYVPDIDTLAQTDFHAVEQIVDRSLRRLDRDVLDMVQFHWWDYDVPGCVDVAGYLTDLRAKGKIRNVSVTNFDTDHLAELVEAGIPVVSMQAQYSVFDRRVERRMRDYCLAHGVALICYGTLAGGFLSERWMGAPRPTDPETRSQVKYLQVIDDSLGWDGYQRLLVLLKGIADAHGVAIANVATRFVLAQPGVAAAIVGVRNSRHVASNAQTFDFRLTDEEVARIRAFIDQYPTVAGEPFEQERTPGSKYRAIMRMNENEA